MAVSRFELRRGATSDNVREELGDIITNLDQPETPLFSLLRRGKSCRNNLTEWLRDEYEAVDTTNAFADGQAFVDPVFIAPGDPGNDNQYVPPARLGVYLHIFRKHFSVTGRAREMDVAGRVDELDRQRLKKAVALRRDMEAIMVDINQATREGATVASGVVGPTSQPLMASLSTWLIQNRENVGTGGTGPALDANGRPTVAEVPGTAGALTELAVLNLMTEIYEVSSRQPDVLMLAPGPKRRLSSFLMVGANRRVATQFQDQGKSPRGGVTVVGSVDVYVTDFGVIDIMPNVRMASAVGRSHAFLLDLEQWEWRFMRGRAFATQQQGLDGDREKHMMLADGALICKSDRSSGVIWNIDPAAAVTAGT